MCSVSLLADHLPGRGHTLPPPRHGCKSLHLTARMYFASGRSAFAWSSALRAINACCGGLSFRLGTATFASNLLHPPLCAKHPAHQLVDQMVGVERAPPQRVPRRRDLDLRDVGGTGSRESLNVIHGEGEKRTIRQLDIHSSFRR